MSSQITSEPGRVRYDESQIIVKMAASTLHLVHETLQDWVMQEKDDISEMDDILKWYIKQYQLWNRLDLHILLD